jgi:hypothetical protein
VAGQCPAAVTHRLTSRPRAPAVRNDGSAQRGHPASALEAEGIAAATTGEAIALTGRAFAVSFGFASGDLLFDLLSLDLVFLALRYQPGFGPLAVAYGAANIASAIPLTPGGLGVIEVTLVAITVGFGAPRATAVLAVLGYRIVNFWLPLIPGAVAYIRLRLVNKPRPVSIPKLRELEVCRLVCCDNGPGASQASPFCLIYVIYSHFGTLALRRETALPLR